jgi:NRPS condensation-like uncharacterized protein
MALTTPLNLLDQQFLPWDQVAPLSFVCELRVQGHLDDERIVNAARTAISHHPMARCRLANFKYGHRRPHWEIVDEVRDIPFEVVECTDDRVFEAARSRLRSRRIDLRTAPPLALMLAHRTGGDSLCMSLSHVVVDGVSSFRLMRSIACAYAGLEEAISGPDPVAVHDLSFYNGGSSAAERIKHLRRVRKLRRAQPPERPTASLATPWGDEDAGDTGIGDFHLWHLNREETAALVARRTAPATLNDLLIGSLALAVRRWNDARGVESGRLDVQMPLNLRPPEWATEVVANLVTDVNIAVPEIAQHDIVSAQLAVAEQTRIAKLSRANAKVDIVTMLNVVPVPLRYPMVQLLQRRQRYNTTIALSNLGRLEFPDFAHDAGAVTEFWLGPSRGSPGGTIATALTLRSELFIALHRKAQLDRAGAQAFAEVWRQVLFGDG